MRRWIETLGYVLCFRLAAMRVNSWPVAWLETAWTGIWYRYYCPYPVRGDSWTAAACNRGGLCGCNNADRFRTSQ
jgi:hypothetical protein